MNTVKAHEHRWVAIKKGFPQKICKCGHLKVGTHTVLLSDFVRYSSPKAPAAAGDLGMAASGRPQFYRAGAVRDVAGLDDITGGGGGGLIAFGGVDGLLAPLSYMVAWGGEPTPLVPFSNNSTRIVAPRAATLRNFYIRSQVGGAGPIFTVLVNGAPTSIVVAISGLISSDTVNTAAVVAGDVIEVQLTGTPTGDAYQGSMEFA